MIISVDVGNTHTVIGGIDKTRIYFQERIETNVAKTDFEFAVLFHNMLEINGIDFEEIEGAILSSVVPQINTSIMSGIKKATGCDVMLVTHDMKLNFTIGLDNPAEMGPDLIVGAAAVTDNYHLPISVVDLGTATTITVIDKNKVFRGGIIHPGITVSLKSLTGNASLLPQINLEGQSPIIGTNTIDCMRSGILYGHAGIIDSTLVRMEQELGEPLTVIATGGLSSYVLPLCGHYIIEDDNLLLKGLLKLYELNR